ncbi:SUKH-4 family immunity protein [Streptomyces griseomycini]|uniref:SUKH-4 immunity protein of toxin-antitoxin system n=1 Tax=Streptomyces griseomycini TaxID=66895 RepID=A0A7W7V8I5_9ACTN|nr:SUKH-4 family immunity protein [Streptomyces griseomycini]MBB4901140.1 hypothetical protein [Streptomyces griseomycini]GGR17265.1 hypothetical protein GCM10015536_23590 [Streptomyces griseomycini]
MSTTDTVATAAITRTEAGLGPYLAHAPTHRRPAGPGLPGDAGPFDFADLCGGGPVPVGPEADPVLLGGAAGEVPTAYFFHDRPDLMDRRPLAPSLPTLVRFAAVTDELAGLRGQLAARAGRRGTRAVADAARLLLAVLEEGADGGPAPLRRTAELVRPLALAAGPGTVSGLALDLPVRLLDREFGRGGVVRFEEVDFPATLTHEPTRRFLRETGLPEDGFLFRPDTDLPPRTLTEHCADGGDGFPPGRLPAHADRLVRLGELVEDHSLVVDGATGAVLGWSEPERVLRPLSTDVSTLASTLWLLHRERAVDEAPGHALTGAAYDRLVMAMIQALSSIDPVGPTDDDELLDLSGTGG